MTPEVCDSLELLPALQAAPGSPSSPRSRSRGPARAADDWVAHQPPWSDFPFIVLVARRIGRRPSAASGALAKLGNVVLLERPLNTDTLVSAARSALRGRERQYQTRRHLIEQEEARIAERIANAEASRANEALEVAVDAGELGTFHCPWPLRRSNGTRSARSTSGCRPMPRSTSIASIRSSTTTIARACARRSTPRSAGAASTTSSTGRSPATARERWIRAKGRVYREASGEPIRFDGVTLDISRQKQLEVEREALLAAERRPASRPSGRAA